ncbi:YesL family protein [Microbacterium amylolyticum]|uniref:Membrane protein YesL n=1 Tax=Microbacterium amylolyticum TaxID=936337 RepID=A0ABS4ZEV7_9MICO|nr:DUF624 domain-containing protein [Microbacterium amylolyticum]MBP2435737.1 putative membrane protein YesL [Microbacterium amylolyticum]
MTAGWAEKTMAMLDVVIRLVAVNLLFIGGVLLGLVVAGIMPATTAACAVVVRSGRDHGVFHTFTSVYRREFVRANVTGLPLGIAAVLVAFNAVTIPGIVGPIGAALLVFTIAAALVTIAVFAIVVTLLVRYDDRPMAVLRYGLLLALTSPLMSVAIVATVVAAAAIGMIAPVLLPLVGLSVPLMFACRVVDARLARIDAGHPAATTP